MESVAGWFNPGNTCSSCDKAGENVDNPQLNAHDPTSSHGWFLWFFGTYYQNFRGLLFGLLIFLSHHAALGSLLFCILYAKCCASGCILLLFPHLIPCDYGPHGMCHSDPGLQSIQLNWSKDMLVRVQPVYLDYLDSWNVVDLYFLSLLIGFNYRVLQQTLYNFSFVKTSGSIPSISIGTQVVEYLWLCDGQDIHGFDESPRATRVTHHDDEWVISRKPERGWRGYGPHKPPKGSTDASWI